MALKYVSEQDARDRLATQVTIGLTGVARIIREYADAGIEFDEKRILKVIDHLQALVEGQRMSDANDVVETGDVPTLPDGRQVNMLDLLYPK